MWDIKRHIQKEEKLYLESFPVMAGIFYQNLLTLIVACLLVVSVDYLGSHSYLNEQFFTPLMVVTLLLPVYVLISIPLLMLSTRYVITNKRLLLREGFFAESIRSVSLKELVEVSFTQSILGKIHNYGTLAVSTRTNNLVLEFTHIHNPIQVAKILEELMSESKGKKLAPQNPSLDT